MSNPRATRRQYSVQGVIGRGGFGTVYRARLDGPEGFSKDVAVKLLRDLNPPKEVLQRFRDEARILGLVRDRAVVAVDPPVQLGGRWAVVMEFVDGVSISYLIKNLGPIPPGPALSIIAEVARALHKMWHLPGPDGEPLELLHRDLKPANLQLTRGGEVKVLDFGIAKASFSARETHTTTSISGTAGYMAPERLTGEEGPTTDVFSLGVVLFEMVVGKRPRLEQLIEAPEEPDPPELAETLALARRLCQMRPDERPSAREVERLATQVAAGLEPALREWAEETVPQNITHAQDALVGSILTETMLIEDTGAPPVPTRSLLVGGMATVMVVVGALLLVAALVVVGLLATNLQDGGDVAAPPVAAEPLVAEPSPIAPPEPEVESGGIEEPAPVEEPESVEEPQPVAVAEPVAVAPRPSVEPPASVAEPEPTRAEKTWPVLFVSVPPDAVVWVDGERRGTTPLTLSLAGGSHEVLLERAEHTQKRTIQTGFRRPVRHLWTIEEGTWDRSY